MKKSLYPIIIAVIIIIVVVIFFYLTRNEVDETNSNSNLNVTTEQTEETCQKDDDCTGTCSCGCIHISTTCPTDNDVLCESVPECECQEGICQEITLAENANTNQEIEEPVQPEPETVETVYQSDFSQTGNLTGDSLSGYTLVYEKPGAPALTADLLFDYETISSQCTIDGIPMDCQDALSQDLLIAGDLVTITGSEITSGVVAIIILDK